MTTKYVDVRRYGVNTALEKSNIIAEATLFGLEAAVGGRDGVVLDGHPEQIEQFLRNYPDVAPIPGNDDEDCV